MGPISVKQQEVTRPERMRGRATPLGLHEMAEEGPNPIPHIDKGSPSAANPNIPDTSPHRTYLGDI